MTCRLLPVTALVVLTSCLPEEPPADADADTDADVDGDCVLADDGGGGCRAGSCCYLDRDERPTCFPGGAREQGDPCSQAGECGCGYACIVLGGEASCAHWCGVETPDDGLCPPPALCSISVTSELEPGLVLGFVCR